MSETKNQNNAMAGFRKPTALDELKSQPQQTAYSELLNQTRQKFEFPADKSTTPTSAEKTIEAAATKQEPAKVASKTSSNPAYDAMGNATGMDSEQKSGRFEKVLVEKQLNVRGGGTITQLAVADKWVEDGAPGRHEKKTVSINGKPTEVSVWNDSSLKDEPSKKELKAPEVKTVVAAEKSHSEKGGHTEHKSKVEPFSKAQQNEILAQANQALAMEQAQEALKEANIALAAEREKAKAALGVPSLKIEIAQDSPSEQLKDNIKNSPVLAELNKALTQEGLTAEQQKMLQEQIARTPETVSYKGELLSLEQAEQKMQGLKKEDLQTAAAQASLAFEEVGYKPTTVQLANGQLYVVDKDLLNQTIAAQGLNNPLTQDFKVTLLDSRTGKETSLEGKSPEELSVQTLEVIKALPQAQGMIAGVTNLKDKEITVVYGDDPAQFKEAFNAKTAQAEKGLEELNNPERLAAQSSVAQAMSALALTDEQGHLANPGKLYKSQDGIQYHEATANLVERVMNEAIAKINPDEKLVGREKLVVTEALLRGDGVPVQVMDKQGQVHELDNELVKHLQKVVRGLNEPEAVQNKEQVAKAPSGAQEKSDLPSKVPEQLSKIPEQVSKVPEATVGPVAENSTVQVHAIKAPEMERARELPHG